MSPDGPVMTRGFVLCAVVLVVGCRERSPSPTTSPAPLPITSAPAPAVSSASRAESLGEDGDVMLPIVARSQAPESPPSGWCGETAIQEGLLHLGVWAPQRMINAAGHPSHPDLYSPEMPVALAELGVKTTVYPARGKGYEPFAKWVRASIDEGDPVIAGVKILPTAHPEWGLDHFVLVVGHGKKGLLVNTTWGHREWVADTSTKGLSFKNAFWAIRLRGVVLPPNAIAARLAPVTESEREVRLRVTCTVPSGPGTYRIDRRVTTSAKPESSIESASVPAEPENGKVEREIVVPADRAARFYCTPT